MFLFKGSSGEEYNDDSDEDEVASTDYGKRAHGVAIDPGWQKSTDAEPPTVKEFTAATGPTQVLPVTSTPLAFFEQIFGGSFFADIVEATNLNAVVKCPPSGNAAHGPYETSDLHWYTTTPQEMRAFFAIVIFMSTRDWPDYEYDNYWSVHPVLYNPYITSIMTQQRFEKICLYLRCSVRHNEDPHDKLAKVRPVISLCEKQFKDCFQPSQNILIDQAMIRYDGRLSWNRYMPCRPEKWGMKLWCLCDSETGYFMAFSIYTDAENVGSDGMDCAENVGSDGTDCAENVGSDGTDHADNVGSCGMDHAEHVGSDRMDHAEHVGSYGMDHAEHVGSDGMDHAEHVGSDGMDHAEHVGSDGMDCPEGDGTDCDEDDGSDGQQGYNVVMTLMQDYMRSNRRLFANSYFTSVRLATDLMHQDTYLCGTYRHCARDFPKGLAKKHLHRYESEKWRSEDGAVMLCKWRKRRSVYNIIATGDVGDDSVRKTRNNHQLVNMVVPQCVLKYQNSMRGVDHLDMMCVGRSGRRWWRYLFWSLINIGIVNAFILWRQCNRPLPANDDLFSMYMFKVKLVEQLADPFIALFDQDDIDERVDRSIHRG